MDCIVHGVAKMSDMTERISLSLLYCVFLLPPLRTTLGMGSLKPVGSYPDLYLREAVHGLDARDHAQESYGPETTEESLSWEEKRR